MPEEEKQVEIRKAIRAPIKQVYYAWTEPDLMKEWMGPGDIVCKNVEVDLKQGGAYKIHEYSPKDNQDRIAYGTYTEINPEKKLQFTWSWEGKNLPETLVTIEFEAKDDLTELKLRHEGFFAKAIKDKHGLDWDSCLSELIRIVEAK